MDDDFLYKYRKPPRRDFTAALYQRISTGTGGSAAMKTKSHTRAWRTAALALSMVAVIAVVLFFSPATRAFAQDIIHQFGGYIFVQGSPQPDLAKAIDKAKMAEANEKVSPEQEATLRAEKLQRGDQPQEEKKPAAPSGKQLGDIVPDAAAASQLTGFSVLAPAYVPAGYTPVTEKDITGGWEVAHENGGVAARVRFENQADQSFLVVEELKYEQGLTRTVERPQIEDVTVRGQPGAWMPDNGGKSTLVWDENGITYLVVGNTLSLDEMQKVAESLGK